MMLKQIAGIVRSASQKLRMIRYNLRKILVLSIESKISSLIKKKDLYRKKTYLTNSQERRFWSLKDQLDNFYWVLTHSICQCPMCKSLEKDMVYNLDLECWICIDCLDRINN